MEIDEANNTPAWVVVQLAESKLIAEELSEKGQPFLKKIL
jgi:hypothetical protein